MRRLVLFSLASCLAVTVAAFAQGTYKIETTKGLPGGDVSQAIQSTLQPQGESLLNSAGKILCEVWLRKDLVAAQTPDTSSNVLYGKIAQGSLVGVIHFPEATKDYRGQPVKAGYYALRYELIPEDGNHMGVSQYRDFLLLVPVAQDTDPAKPLKFDQAVKVSRQSTGTGHPGILSMESTDQIPSQIPAAFKDYSDNWAVAAKTQVKSAAGEAKDLPLAFVLVGKYEG